MLNILHAIDTPLSILDTDGTIRHINHAMEDYLGVSSKHIVGEDSHTVLHPSNLDKEHCPLCQALKHHQIIDKLNLYNSTKQLQTQYSMNFTKIDTQESVILTLTNTTHTHAQHQEIKNLNQRMALALHGYNAGVYEWNMLDNSAYLSSEWKMMLGYDKNEPLAAHLSTWKDRVHPDDINTIMHSVQETLEKHEKNIETIHRLRHKNGHWIWVMGRGVIQYDNKGNALSMTGIHTDISERIESENLIQEQANNLYKLAHYDMLTGLANRVLLTNKLLQSIAYAKDSHTQLAIMFIDINKFKHINDSLGHHTGDKILKVIAKRLKNIVRDKDTVSRFGGDEFIILIEKSSCISPIKSKIDTIFKEPIKIVEIKFLYHH